MHATANDKAKREAQSTGLQIAPMAASTDELNNGSHDKRDLVESAAPYKLKCNTNKNVNEKGYKEVLSKLDTRNFCGIGKLADSNGVAITATQWGNAARDYKVRCDHVATAVGDIWESCGSKGGKSFEPLRLLPSED